MTTHIDNYDDNRRAFHGQQHKNRNTAQRGNLTIGGGRHHVGVHCADAFAEDGANTSDAPGAGADNSVEQIAGPVPNIIITNFTYGDGSVAVGSTFNLGFTFQNMGKVAVSNMVVTVDGGENFAISGGTNTFYYDALNAGAALTQTVPMQTLASAKNGAQGIDISFKYEYVDGAARSSNTSDIKISVPVSQPDRFELNDPVVPNIVNAGEETTITMDYVNKGKGDVSNVEASVEGDGITATQAKQYVGNVASGASGSIGFAFTADKPGETEAKLTVTYENSDGQPQTKEFPVKINAVEAPVPDDSDTDVDVQDQSMPVWVWIVAAAVALVVIVLTVVLVVRHRRKKAKQVPMMTIGIGSLPILEPISRVNLLPCCRCADAGNRHGRWHIGCSVSATSSSAPSVKE